MVDLPFPRVSAPPAPDAGVRPARSDDVPTLAALQRATWLAAYAGVVTEAVLDAAELEAQWSEAVSAPPSSHHVVLVATAAGQVVGYAVGAPDEDTTSGPAGEIVDLVVAVERTRAGHGSRLLAAVVDHLRRHGDAVVHAWCDAGDDVRRDFLESAGLAADGTRRRLHTGGDDAALVQLRFWARLD